MRATVMPRAHEVRIENVPDATVQQPTDAVIRITRACICGSDLWPYNGGPNVEGQRMGHEAIGVVEAVGSDGAVGLCGVIAAKRLGAEQIIIMGRHQPRIELARAFGATDIVRERGG